MIILVLGQQDSGKSALAEELAVKTGDKRRYYLATMKVYDEEGRTRVAKHREKRAGKGFETIEKEYAISTITSQVENPQDATLLLECVSNLVGNELFENPKWEKLAKADPAKAGIASLSEKDCNTFALEVMEQIRSLAKSFHHLICVSNTYDADDSSYDDQTRLYIKLLDLVNEKLQGSADQIYDLRKGLSS